MSERVGERMGDGVRVDLRTLVRRWIGGSMDQWIGRCTDEVTLLGMLDMSAAFDTVDHDILLSRLQTSFGMWSSTVVVFIFPS